MVLLRKVAMWAVWNVTIGRLAPWVMAFALGRKPVRPNTS